MKRNILFFCLLMTTAAYSQQSSVMMYDKPAVHFEDALPIGNGRIGCMVYGGIGKDRISLNEATLWAGYPVDSNILKKHGRSVPINHSSSNSKT